MSQPFHTARPRLPAFSPVPVKRRADGWTPVRQAEFIGVLAETGSVRAAAAFVGMARETAYRLRGKPGAEGVCAGVGRGGGDVGRAPLGRLGARGERGPAHTGFGKGLT